MRYREVEEEQNEVERKEGRKRRQEKEIMRDIQNNLVLKLLGDTFHIHPTIAVVIVRMLSVSAATVVSSVQAQDTSNVQAQDR